MKINAILTLALASGALFVAHREEVSAYSLTGIHWNSSAVSYVVNPNFPGAAAGTPTQQVAEVTAGASAWHQQAQVPFDFNYTGTSSVASVAYDGVNSVHYSPTDGNGALAICYWWSVGGVALQFDIEYYAKDGLTNFVWARNPTASQFDIRSVAVHEFGHALGLDHSAVPSASMYPSVAAGSTALRTLDADDISGARAIYGVATPSLGSVFPVSGSAVGGTTVTVTGSNLTSNATTVTVGGIPAIDVTVLNSSTMTFVTPSAMTATGPVNVVLTCNGLSSTLVNGFRFEELTLGSALVRGAVVPVAFNAPQYPGAYYQAVISLSGGGDTLMGDYLDANDMRVLPVAVDELFMWNVLSPSPTWFTNFYGALNGAGHATGFFAVPTHPAVAGIGFRLALCVYEEGAPSGIALISNGVSATAQ